MENSTSHYQMRSVFFGDHSKYQSGMFEDKRKQSNKKKTVN